MVESAPLPRPPHPVTTVADDPDPAPAQPVSSRVAALDVLRGIAILGTLGTNVWIFTNAEGLLGYIARSDEPHGAWLWIERFLQQLAQGKFLGLLTIMFGIGLAIQQRSAVRGGRAWPGSYPVRAGLLFLDGLLNFFLVAEFDVLMGYAITGLVVAFILATGPKAQRRWLIAQASVHLTLLSLFAVAIAVGSPDDSGPRRTLDPNPYADGSFWDLVAFRWEHLLVFRLEPLLIFPMSIALFLLGARLFRAGIFEPGGARIRKRLMLIGFGIAAPVDLALGLIGGDLILLARYGTAPVVSLGLLALVAEVYAHRPRPGWVGRRFGEVGRMALSCYILQNLVAGFLCYGWGLGLASLVSANARVPFTVGIYVLVCALMLVFAHFWLRRVERGPVEWLWNRSYLALTGAARG
ncbi:DUF418 domain-containing protein [Nocardia sp. NPDC056611]|uniref:DUF418 domain-containing protein n=1 Tax=Nocardia sp. NPDC056611 TaxID=3345877 RepID=UPI003671EB81